MMEELKGYVALRNRVAAIDLPAVENFLFLASGFIMNHPEIQEMDINPLFVSLLRLRCSLRRQD